MKDIIKLLKKKMESSDEKMTRLEMLMITYLLKVDKNLKDLRKISSQNNRFLKILEEETRPLTDEDILDIPISFELYKEICETCDIDRITFMGVA